MAKKTTKKSNKNTTLSIQPSLSEMIKGVGSQQDFLKVQEMILLEKAMKGDDPTAMMFAAKRWKDIEERTFINKKALLIDPLEQAGAMGFKNKATNITNQTLRAMSKAPVPWSIITTRTEQVASFCQPQPDKYSPGFIIRKKPQHIYASSSKSQESTDADKRVCGEITDFILNCGSAANVWHGDDFSTFIRKVVQDSLTFDVLSYEVVRNRKGIPIEFFATDAGTMRIASSFIDDEYTRGDKIAVNGYFPSYVQVIDEIIRAEFYPWELCFGIRNPTTSIYNNGYGQSELENLVTTITSLIYSDAYNASFFKQGTAPKGILKVSGGINPETLARFKQEWRSMMVGKNGWNKTPVIESENMEFIDMSKNNRDMEFSKFQEYLIRLTCGIYKIDPSEIGFELGKMSGQNPTFEGNNEAKLKYSKDKGLVPLLKFVEAKINKFIINPINPLFEFKFVGVDEDTPQAELEADIKKLANFMTLNEIRKKYELKGLGKEADIVLNSMYVQMINAKQQREDMQKQQQMGGGQDPNQQGQEEQQDGEDGNYEENPFTKGIDIALEKAILEEV